MKKIFSFVAAALMSVSMFAGLVPAPDDETLNGYKGEGDNVVVAIYVDDAIKCGDIVFTGTFNNFAGDAAACIKFQPVEGFAGWYVATLHDESESIDGKPVHLSGDLFNWDYQVGDAETVRGAATVVPGTYAGEIDIKGYGTEAPNLLNIKGWKNDPCTVVYKDYTITLISPDCNEEDYITPAISGGFNTWAQQAMEMDELATAERQQAGLLGAVYKVTANAAVGSEYKFRSSEEWGKDWTNELKEWDAEAGDWKAFNDGQNFKFGDETELTYDLSDPEKYTWTNCDKPAPVEYKYTEYVNWQLKHEGSGWEWTENLEKVEEGLFKLADADWTGSGFNVGSDENPIKKDWFAPEDLTVGEEVIAPITVDVYLKVIDDETVAIGVGVIPEEPTALKHVKAVKASKAIMKDGQIIFQAGEKVYNVLGAEVK